MTRREQNPIVDWVNSLRTAALVLAMIVLALVASQSAQAQTLSVIHNFTGPDGASPYAGLTLDKAGNFYGTALNGGVGDGTVFQLKRKGSGLTFNPLYSFAGGNDGDSPSARVIFGPDGSLYGTTVGGGDGNGTVFNLKPQATACKTALCSWSETVLYRFNNFGDGAYPHAEVAFDQAGSLYSTTLFGGLGNCGLGCGVVFELTPSGGGWTYSVPYKFTSGGEGSEAGVIFDNAGNLYGPDTYGGNNERGMIYELTPSGSGWTENTLYTFPGNNGERDPYGGLIFDGSGNLYGTTSDGGTGGGGTVFELIPSNGSWTLNTIYSFTGQAGAYCGPGGSLVMDGAGNLYGTTYCDGTKGFGNVFELTPSGGSWAYTSLHDFTGGNDGAMPLSNVVIDSSGNLYGTASAGGTGSACTGGCGVVWEITP